METLNHTKYIGKAYNQDINLFFAKGNMDSTTKYV
jgi:hypothetical protein